MNQPSSQPSSSIVPSVLSISSRRAPPRRARFCGVLGVVLATLLSVASSAGAVTRTEEKTHVVVQGQTLRGIAKRFKITIDELREANDLTPGTRLKVGTRLVIPVAGSTGSKRDRATKDDDAEDEKRKKRDRRERDDKSDRDREGLPRRKGGEERVQEGRRQTRQGQEGRGRRRRGMARTTSFSIAMLYISVISC